MLLWIMEKGLISLKDALAIMACRDAAGNFIPCDIERITCNLSKGTGGRRVFMQGVTLAGPQFGKKNSAKDPRHWINGTRNIMVPGKPRPITIQNVLITAINGERTFI